MALQAETEKSFLLTLRWISAAIVMFGHSYSVIFHRYVDMPFDGSVGTILEQVAHYRHSAVVIFFVLSGYLVGGGVLRAAGGFQFDR